VTTKICSKCKVEKDVGEFWKCKASKDGLAYQCKSCASSRARRWRAENPDKVAEQGRRWRAENPGKSTETSRRWRAENPEKATELGRRWQIENPEKCRESSRRWRAKNPEKIAEKAREWRAKNPERSREISKKYIRRGIEGLSDYYVKLTLNVPNPPQELIELKRLQLQIHRELKQQGEVK